MKKNFEVKHLDEDSPDISKIINGRRSRIDEKGREGVNYMKTAGVYQLQFCMFHGLRQRLEGLEGIIDRYEVVRRNIYH